MRPDKEETTVAELGGSAEARTSRLGPDDGEAIYAARLRRQRVHGSVNLGHSGVTSEAVGTDICFAPGYTDGPDGIISHWLWCGTKDVDHGPCQMHLSQLEEPGVRGRAYWQTRIRDLPARLERTHLIDEHPRFNLRLAGRPRVISLTTGPGVARAEAT